MINNFIMNCSRDIYIKRKEIILPLEYYCDYELFFLSIGLSESSRRLAKNYSSEIIGCLPC